MRSFGRLKKEKGGGGWRRLEGVWQRLGRARARAPGRDDGRRGSAVAGGAPAEAERKEEERLTGGSGGGLKFGNSKSNVQCTDSNPKDSFQMPKNLEKILGGRFLGH